MNFVPAKKTMLAQQYDASDNKVHLNEIPIPEPGDNELLVKIRNASLCHSELMLFAPNHSGVRLEKNPVTVGHEATGTVVDMGPGEAARAFRRGDCVGFLPTLGCCFDCLNCRNVHNVWCETGNMKIAGFGADGFFQEYAIVDARAAMTLPEGLDVRKSAPLFCAGVSAFNAIQDCALDPGQWVAVIGCGGLGHLGIQYAKAMCLKVIAVDIAKKAVGEARACGADVVFNSTEEKGWKEKIVEITGGGVPAAVNFTAAKETYDDMPAILKPGGGLLVVCGIPREPLQFNALDIISRRYQIKGSNIGVPVDMRRAIEFSAKHNIKPRQTVYKLEELPMMMELMQSHKAHGRMGVVFVEGACLRRHMAGGDD